jgi:RHS repeat-associated protein
LYQTKETTSDNITSYSYDLAGNRLQMRKVENAQVINEVDYTLGIGNRLASWGNAGEAHYDLAGCLTNMVSDVDGRELNLSWNSKYQLSTVDVAGGTNVNYDYNVLGQRISRKEITGSTTNTEYYIHEGVNIVADLDVDKNLLRSYTYAPAYDNIISMTIYGDDTNTYFYIRNHINSVVALVDENGDIAESYDYDSYGSVTVFDANGNELEQSALGNRYTFQGREVDYTTGLYNFRARWYDSETGRWLSKDSIGIKGGFNQYVFCGDNPVMFADPAGLEAQYYTSDNLDAFIKGLEDRFQDLYTQPGLTKGLTDWFDNALGIDVEFDKFKVYILPDDKYSGIIGGSIPVTENLDLDFDGSLNSDGDFSVDLECKVNLGNGLSGSLGVGVDSEGNINGEIKGGWNKTF